MNDHEVRRAWSVVVFGIGWGTVLVSVVHAQIAAPVIDQKSSAHAQIVSRLKEACATKPELFGVLVQGGELAGGVLRLSGTLDKKTQAALLEARANEILDGERAWKAQMPGGANASGMAILPVRSELLPKVRGNFASAAAAANRLSLLQQTRLDDFTFDTTGRLKVVGLCVNQRAYLDSRKEKADPTQVSPRAQVAQAVRDRLKTYPLPAGVDPSVLSRVDADCIEIKEDPARRLQLLASGTSGLDDLLFINARFDADGELRLDGLLGSENQRAAAAGLVDRPKIARVYARPGGIPPAESTAAVAAMVVAPWRSTLLVGMQERFARPGNKGSDLDILRYCRLDRARFGYSEQGGGLKLHFEGVTLIDADPSSSSSNRIVAALQAESKRLFKTTMPVEYNSVNDLKPIPHPRRALQEKVAGEPSVDGVRVDDVTIGPKGETVVEGLWVGENQAALLDPLLQLVLAEQTGGKVSGPLTHHFAAVPTDQILKDLRSKSAAAFDETSLDRLSFQLLDEKSSPVPVLQGSTPEPRVKELSAMLAGWLQADPRTEVLGVPSVGLSIAGRPGSLLKELRTLIAREPALDGVRVDRVVFDESNTLTLSGRHDHDGQAAQALALVPATVAKVWPNRPPLAPARAGNFSLAPLAVRLEWLRKVLPYYPGSDGVILSRAYYGSDGVLTFGGRGAGVPAQHPALEKLIKDLLKVDPKQQVKLGLRIEPRDPARTTRLVGKSIESLVNGAITTVRIEDLDEAIFLNPDDSTAWYLRAAYYQATGDHGTAERDLVRVKRLETNIANRKQERFRMLTKFQGAPRQALDELEAGLPNNR